MGEVSCETDRARFLGRGRSTRDPVALESAGPLSGTTGAVLDPIFALRARVRLEPGQSASVAFTTLVTDSRDHAFELADRYRDPHAAQRAMDLAWTSSQVELRELNISPSDAAVFQELAGYLFYGNPALRAPQAELRRNKGSQPQLWSQGVSGDWPILLATIDDEDGLPTLRQLLAAHRYWRRRGMTVDLVVLNSNPHGYQQELAERITAAVVALGRGEPVRPSGGVFVRRRDQLSPNELLMLRATARVHLSCDGRPLGRALATALTVEEWEEPETDELPRPRSPERSRSRVVRAVLRIGAKIPDLLSPLASSESESSSRPSRESAVGVRQRVRCLGRQRRLRDPRSGRPGAARAVVERHRESPRRLPGDRARRRLHLGGEQLLLSAHALAQRPGRRRGERGHLFPGCRIRRGLVRDTGAGAQRHRLHCAARPWIVVLRASAAATSACS